MAWILARLSKVRRLMGTQVRSPLPLSEALRGAGATPIGEVLPSSGVLGIIKPAHPHSAGTVVRLLLALWQGFPGDAPEAGTPTVLVWH